MAAESKGTTYEMGIPLGTKYQDYDPIGCDVI